MGKYQYIPDSPGGKQGPKEDIQPFGPDPVDKYENKKQAGKKYIDIPRLSVEIILARVHARVGIMDQLDSYPGQKSAYNHYNAGNGPEGSENLHGKKNVRKINRNHAFFC